VSAYYNEFEPYAAQWIRNLIKAGLIPDGEVDGRSIREVKPDDLRGFTQCHFFAGLAGWGCALRLAGWPDDREIWTGSPPCQPFSVAGKRAGTADDRHLWPDLFRLIRSRRPVVLMGEQVSAAIGMGWVDGVRLDLEGEGYAARFTSVPACAVNAPHRRDRLWFVAETLEHTASARQSTGTPGTLAQGWDEGRGGESERRGGDGWSLADRAEQSEREPQHANGTESRPNAGGLGGLGGFDGGAMVNNSRVGRGEGRPESEFRRGRTTATGASGPSVGDARREGLQIPQRETLCGTWRRQEGRATGESSGSPSHVPDAYSPERPPSEPAGHVVDGNDAGREEKTGRPWSSGAGSISNAKGSGRSRECLRSEGGGPSDGVEKDGLSNFWHDSEWINGADGKARRVKSGIRLLAHGVPEGVAGLRTIDLLAKNVPARVGKLRALGNAIVPQVAAEVIKAYMDVRP
jgi:site-specific DNA-cytosine methylase